MFLDVGEFHFSGIEFGLCLKVTLHAHQYFISNKLFVTCKFHDETVMNLNYTL